MPLLAGIFAKRDRQSGARSPPSNLIVPTTPTSEASISSTVVSSEPDYVFPDKSIKSIPPTVYTGPPAASSSKLKLPFRRRHVHQPHVTGTIQGVFSLNDSPPRAHISGVVSDSGHDLPPSPPKPSFFGVYHDPSVNSTLSLPGENTRRQSRLHPPSVIARNEIHSAPPSSMTTPPNLKKSGGLFSWARERTKSKPAPPATIGAPLTPSPHPKDSFNLKAFRHVRSDSPTPPAADIPDTELPLPPARPRPRGDSVASDSSQRISVAAFREAQARRSRAGSPAPSFRLPSSLDALRVENVSRQRASTVSTPTGSEYHLPSNRNSTAPPLSILINQNSSAVDTSTSESDESDEDNEEVDSDGVPIKPSRKRTVTRRPGPRSRSDAGHAAVSNAQVQRPEPPRWSKSDNGLLRQPDSPASVRARASASTSALTPNAAARRASTLAAANTSSASSASDKPLPSPVSPRAANNDDSDTSSDSDNDSEDMPLSALVAPRRPGSSASISTTRSAASRPRMPAKPLIDIKSLVGSAPLLTPVLRHEHSVKAPSRKGKEREVDRDEPFAPPPVISLTPSRLAENPAPVTPHSPTGPPPNIHPPIRHKRSISDIGHVPRTSSSPISVDDDLMDAIRLVSSFDQSRDTSQSPTRPSQQVPPLNIAPPAVERVANAADKPESPRDDRIVPTPVREYKPPASFSVTSRPPRRYSTDLSQAVSPASPTTTTFSAASKRSSSPQRSPSPIKSLKSSFAPRYRAATLAQQPNVPSNDKSDASSVVSASRSSRSSRVPPVPLITAVPDSPSVKASWGSSKDLYKTRVPSTPGVLESRTSRPPSGTLVSLVPSSRPGMPTAPRPQSQSLMPSRPFASNSSLRGESPAGSSTGDSSSGRGAPFTPRDGSDIGVQTGRRDGSEADLTLKARGANAKRSTVSFEDSPPRGRERVKNDADDEGRRNERRRTEAKAAIELGKIVNGRGPIVHNGSDDDLVPQHGQRMSINPMMGMDQTMSGMNAPVWGPWQQPMQTGMGHMIAPQFGPDQNFLAAHQHAMMIAKQAYQMTVAQHAMAMAGDEWERGSNVGGGSVYGGGGGSVYSGMGGGGGMGMLSVPGMNIPGMMPNQWSAGPMMFPSRISGTQSEFGGGSRSVYGESFGPSMSSRSSYAPAAYGAQNSAASAYGGGPRPRAKTGASQPSNLQPQTPGRSPGRKAAPPSSWKSTR